jgi:predicted nucleic acid-binding Zn ribbon protein
MQNERIEIDPFGCPYCGGPVSIEASRCDDCGRSVELREQRRAGWKQLKWLLVLFVLLALAAWLQGYFVSQMATWGPLPDWTRRLGLHLLTGPLPYRPEGIQGDMVDLAQFITLLNYLLVPLCLVAMVGLVLRSRVAYFGSFLLMGLMVLVTVVGLLTELTGWLPALLRLGLVALSTQWLAESSAAFEWQTRKYNASIDRPLKTSMDYYARGKRYSEMGMWAKAAAHWQVATRLAPDRVPYRVALAGAYLRMDDRAAARAELDGALTLASDDEELHTLRGLLAEVEETD